MNKITGLSLWTTSLIALVLLGNMAYAQDSGLTDISGTIDSEIDLLEVPVSFNFARPREST